MHSFIPDLQINYVSFYVCQTHTVIEASMRKGVLHIHVTDQLVVVANGMDIFCFLCVFKPRFVKYFVMFFGYITWFYGLPVLKLMTDLFMTLLNTCHC